MTVFSRVLQKKRTQTGARFRATMIELHGYAVGITPRDSGFMANHWRLLGNLTLSERVLLKNLAPYSGQVERGLDPQRFRVGRVRKIKVRGGGFTFGRRTTPQGRSVQAPEGLVLPIRRRFWQLWNAQSGRAA